jgi:hypothetical protein
MNEISHRAYRGKDTDEECTKKYGARESKGVGSLFKIDLKEQEVKIVGIGRGRPESLEALEEMASTMGLLGIEFYMGQVDHHS